MKNEKEPEMIIDIDNRSYYYDDEIKNKRGKFMKNLFTSKKFIVCLISVILMVINELVIQINVEKMLGIISPLLLYIVGQGIADIGKEKAKVKNGGGSE